MTASTSLVTGTDFITVSTKDIDAAVDFYGKVLGLPESKRWGSMPAVEFETGNVGLTQRLCDLLADAGSMAPILYASSIQAANDNSYGRSKAAAEQVLLDHAAATGTPVAVFRLPNVFGKWTRISYNSAVATFCHRIARGETIDIHDPAAPLRLPLGKEAVARIRTKLERQLADMESTMALTLSTAYP